MDFTHSEMQAMLDRLANKLDLTQGDQYTHSYLSDIAGFLRNMGTDIKKISGTKTTNNKDIADEIASKLDNKIKNTTKVNVDIIDKEVKKSITHVVDEMTILSSAFDKEAKRRAILDRKSSDVRTTARSDKEDKDVVKKNKNKDKITWADGAKNIHGFLERLGKAKGVME